MSNDPEFDELKREFLSEAGSKVEEIRRLLSETSPERKEACERMRNLAHQLKGAGGSYGFPSISSDAAALETALERMDDGGSAELRKEIEGRLQNLNQFVDTRLRDLSA